MSNAHRVDTLASSRFSSSTGSNTVVIIITIVSRGIGYRTVSPVRRASYIEREQRDVMRVGALFRGIASMS